MGAEAGQACRVMAHSGTDALAHAATARLRYAAQAALISSRSPFGSAEPCRERVPFRSERFMYAGGDHGDAKSRSDGRIASAA